MRHVLTMLADIEPEAAAAIAASRVAHAHLTYDGGDIQLSNVRITVLPEDLTTLPRGTLIEVKRIRETDADIWGSRRVNGRWRGVLGGGDSVLLVSVDAAQPVEYAELRVDLRNISEWEVAE